MSRGLAIRLAMLSTHYRKPIDFKMDATTQAEKTLAKWHRKMIVNDGPPSDAFMSAMMDDMNTPQAIAELHRSTPEQLYAGLKLLGLTDV